MGVYIVCIRYFKYFFSGFLIAIQINIGIKRSLLALAWMAPYWYWTNEGFCDLVEAYNSCEAVRVKSSNFMPNYDTRPTGDLQKDIINKIKKCSG